MEAEEAAERAWREIHNGPESVETAFQGQTRRKAGEPRADRVGIRAGRSGSSRPGTLTPEWRLPRRSSRCGRAKGRYERPAPCGRSTAVSREHRSRGGEIGLGGAERRSTRHFRMRCSVPCMPAESKAGNRVTWNHFFFCPPKSCPVASPIVLPDWKHSLATGPLTIGVDEADGRSAGGSSNPPLQDLLR